MKITRNSKNNGFFLDDIIGIIGINYAIELDKHYEYQSNLLIQFKTQNNTLLHIKFYNISACNLNGLGGVFNYIDSVEFIENISYEKDHKYHIKDYENGMIDFYCESYEQITTISGYWFEVTINKRRLVFIYQYCLNDIRN